MTTIKTTVFTTYCDYCNPDHVYNSAGQGFLLYCKEKEAIERYGWLKTEKGIMCFACQSEGRKQD